MNVFEVTLAFYEMNGAMMRISKGLFWRAWHLEGYDLALSVSFVFTNSFSKKIVITKKATVKNYERSIKRIKEI